MAVMVLAAVLVLAGCGKASPAVPEKGAGQTGPAVVPDLAPAASAAVPDLTPAPAPAAIPDLAPAKPAPVAAVPDLPAAPKAPAAPPLAAPPATPAAVPQLAPMQPSEKTTTIKLPVTRDVWISGEQDEAGTSMGRTPKLKLKGRSEFCLMDFDVDQLKGKRVVTAWLYCCNLDPKADLERLGIVDRPDCLRYIAVSTVSSPWEEGTREESYQPDQEGGGASFNEAGTGRRPWAWNGSRIWDVIMTGGFGRYGIRERDYVGEGWWRVLVEQDVIAACVAGTSDGLCVMDLTGPGGGSSANNHIASREAGAQGPYLEITVADDPAAPPPAVTVLACGPGTVASGMGTLALEVVVPERAFVYAITIEGAPAPLWQVPPADKAGARQTISFTDLEPDRDYGLMVAAVDRAGRVSPPVKASGWTSALLKVPAPPAAAAFAAGTLTDPGRTMTVAAAPMLAKVDPLTGKVDGREAGRPNAVWDGAAGTVRLAAPRGGIAGFQLVIGATGATLADVRVAVPAGTPGLRLTRAWYVKAGETWQAEYAAPLPEAMTIPMADNAVPGQKFQSVACDISVSYDAPAGELAVSLMVTAAGGAAVTVPVTVTVRSVTVPAELGFNPELNCYGIAFGGGEPWRAAHILAHYHRSTLNNLPYNQRGQVAGAYKLPLEGQGAGMKVTDWSAFDREIGPILSGALFAENPRGPVPVKTFYLPLCEGWPASLSDNLAFKPSREHKAFDMQFYLAAPPLEKLIAPAYGEALRAVTAAFAAHFAEAGYTRTLAEMYLNNKPKAGNTTWWSLDEPRWWEDFRAIEYHARLFRAARTAAPAAVAGNFVFRGDISRPQWQFDFCDAMDIIYTNSGAFDMARTVQGLVRRTGMTHYVYGSCNAPSRPNTETAAWCLKAFAMGADGVLPWNTVGDEKALTEPDENGLLVPGTIFGVPVVASYRLHALREGAELCELLRLAAARQGWTRAQAGMYAAQFVPLGGEFRQARADDASAVTFGDLDADGFVRLKTALLGLAAAE